MNYRRHIFLSLLVICSSNFGVSQELKAGCWADPRCKTIEGRMQLIGTVEKTLIGSSNRDFIVALNERLNEFFNDIDGKRNRFWSGYSAFLVDDIYPELKDDCVNCFGFYKRVKQKAFKCKNPNRLFDEPPGEYSRSPEFVYLTSAEIAEQNEECLENENHSLNGYEYKDGNWVRRPYVMQCDYGDYIAEHLLFVMICPAIFEVNGLIDMDETGKVLWNKSYSNITNDSLHLYYRYATDVEEAIRWIYWHEIAHVSGLREGFASDFATRMILESRKAVQDLPINVPEALFMTTLRNFDHLRILYLEQKSIALIKQIKLLRLLTVTYLPESANQLLFSLHI
jgi:hypothetical protein